MNDWIEWHGGECPVDAGTSVDLKFADGEVVENDIASRQRWDSNDRYYKIIAYRVVDPCATAPATS